MRVFVLPQVSRLMRKERLPDVNLCRAAREVIAYRPPRTDRVLFTYVFAKNAAVTLTQQGQGALTKAAAAFMAADDQRLTALMTSDDVREIECDGNGQG